MKQWLVGILLFICTESLAQGVVTQNISDDSFVEVPLQFAFPYYGQLFTTSWMFDNGVVGFFSPLSGYNGGQNFFSQSFSQQLGPQFNYMIAPLWTDLDNYSGSFTTQGDSTFQRYTWNNISQWGYPENLNSFSLEIFPSGTINVQYDQVNITGFPVSVGTTGNLEQLEFQQMFYSLPESATSYVSDWNMYVPSPETEDPCTLNPLYSSDCAGYGAAYALENIINETEDIIAEEPINTDEVVETVESIESTETVEETTQLIAEQTSTITASTTNIIAATIINNLTEASTPVETVNTLTITSNIMLDDEEFEITSESVEQPQVEINSVVNNNTAVVFSNNNMQQMLAMGGNITQILNTPVPDFSRFDMKLPSQEEQVQSAKIENQLEKMNENEIEDQAEQLIGSMDPNAQAAAVQLIGYKAGFDQYGKTINDQSNWYQNVSVYNNNRLPSGSNLLFGAQDDKHQELMSLQYRR